LPRTFDPVRFEPEKWAEAARKAGMKYVVFTTKHHDGFCMFDSKLTDYKITGPDCPFAQNPRSNVAKEIFGAFRREGLWTGAYFSKPDWHSDHYWWKRFPPSDRNCNYSIEKYPEKWAQFKQFTHGQIEELMTGYGKIDILWLDGGWVRPKTEAELAAERLDHYEGSLWARYPQSQDIDMPALVQKARTLQPGLIVVDRAVPGIHQNYLTPEQHIPDEGLPYPWETCMTMATSWSYVPNDRYKSADELIEKLVDISSKGGNFLLNIGPSPTGEWDADAYDRLAQMGAWLEQNGKAIYGTRMWKTFGEGERIRFTQSKDGQILYVFLFDPPQKTLTIKQLGEIPKNSEVKWLCNGAALPWKQSAEGLQIQFPPEAAKVSNHVWVLEVK
jgi:alpha-L-fucosidase